MDTTAKWPQDLGLVKPMEELLSSSNNNTAKQKQQEQQQLMEKRERPHKEQALHCPRCKSTNTKFCYYNNYSLTQPRYFCKTCRRYWTEGGTLRNVPVGGGSRKNKRSSSSTTTSSLPTVLSSSSKIKPLSDMIPKNPNEGQDLNLAFPALPEFSSNYTTATAPLSAMELLRSTGRISGKGPDIPFMPMPEYPSGFGDYMRSNTLTFPLDGNYSMQLGVQDSGGRLLFPFEDSRVQMDSNNGEGFDNQQNKGFWNEGGGSW